ncbi:MAG: adenosylmethionine--8-amino-7-oxononanoate transaminase [Bacteroidota bacterium]
MSNSTVRNLAQRDQAVIWHPYTQMYTTAEPLPVVRGDGARLILEDGRSILDMISSWWVTVHGHAHPKIADAIGLQARTLEQVIFAGCTHPQAVELAERLLVKIGAPMTRVFFTDDGSTAVEVGLKMAWQYWQNRGENRTRIIAMEHAYHGDTFGAMSVSARSVFTQAFNPLLFEVQSIPSPADVSEEVLFSALAEACRGDQAVAIILEPLVQGAGGMKMYSPAVLDRIVNYCQEKGVLVIFDEVMTGFYRTGKLLSAHHLQHRPDIICLSKGLTGGFLPMALTVCSDAVYEAFLSQDSGRMLFHGHSFTGNPLGCAAANASLSLFERPETQARIARIVALQAKAAEFFGHNERVTNVRQTGTILAMDLVQEGPAGYLNASGKAIAQHMLGHGILIRPLGEVIYLMPPYVTEPEDLELVYDRLDHELRRPD